MVKEVNMMDEQLLTHNLLMVSNLSHTGALKLTPDQRLMRFLLLELFFFFVLLQKLFETFGTLCTYGRNYSESSFHLFAGDLTGPLIVLSPHVEKQNYAQL